MKQSRNTFIGSILVIITLVVPFVSSAQQSKSASTSCPNITRVLKLGDTDSKTNGQVTLLQQFLVSVGSLSASTTLNGNFGSGTRRALMSFQKSNGIAATGSTGPATRSQIAKACSSRTKTSTSAGTRPLSIIQQVDSLTKIPAEPPTVLTIPDSTSLTQQPFFAKASKGDSLLIFAQAKRAILFSSSTKSIINDGPIQGDIAAVIAALQPRTEKAADGPSAAYCDSILSFAVTLVQRTSDMRTHMQALFNNLESFNAVAAAADISSYIAKSQTLIAPQFDVANDADQFLAAANTQSIIEISNLQSLVNSLSSQNQLLSEYAAKMFSLYKTRVLVSNNKATPTQARDALSEANSSHVSAVNGFKNVAEESRHVLDTLFKRYEQRGCMTFEATLSSTVKDRITLNPGVSCDSLSLSKSELAQCVHYRTLGDKASILYRLSTITNGL